jgi:hypothetical protein
VVGNAIALATTSRNRRRESFMTLLPTFSEVEGISEPMSIYFSSRPEAQRLPFFDFKERRRVPAVSSKASYTSPLAICRGDVALLLHIPRLSSDVRFWGKADITQIRFNVRF